MVYFLIGSVQISVRTVKGRVIPHPRAMHIPHPKMGVAGGGATILAERMFWRENRGPLCGMNVLSRLLA